MNEPRTDSTKPAAAPATAPGRPYEPPRLTGKQALAQVTLFSSACTPGTPGCTIGHP
jgi:hypothetical protein